MFVRGISCQKKLGTHIFVRKIEISFVKIGEDGVNWPVGLSGRPHLCDI